MKNGQGCQASYIRYEERSGVAFISLNRPDKKNAINAEMDLQLRAAFNRATGSASVKVIVLKGEGSTFCSGADRKANVPDQKPGWEIIPSSPEAFRFSYFLESEKIIIAGISGHAIGVGAVLACLCDLRIAAENARFAFPYPRMGLIAEYGIVKLLSDIVGKARASELLLRGCPVNSEQAFRLGLVNEVVSSERFDAYLESYAQDLAQNCSAYSLRTIKAQLAAMDGQSFLSCVQLAGHALETARQTWEYQEAKRAFQEKRPVDFNQS